jgi:tetratricopeptide (TPR) repeat protein
MKRAILILLTANVLGWGASWAQGAYSSQQVQAYLTSRQSQSAVRYALAWIWTEPNNDNAWGSLALAYGAQHQPDKAIPALKYALAINPYSPQNFNMLGDQYLEARKFRAAADAFEQAAELAPTKSSYWNSLATAYSDMNERDHALDALKKNEVVAAPRGTWIDWYNLGNAYYRLQAYERAANAFSRALDSNPRGATIWTSLGLAEQSSGRLESAMEHFKLAMSLGDKAGAQNYAKLQSSTAANAGGPLTAMTPKLGD